MPAPTKLSDSDFEPERHGGTVGDDDFAPSDPPLPPEAGSVFSRPTTTGEKLKGVGKGLVKLGVGAGLPMAAGALAGPEAGAATRIGLQAAGGAVAPYAEAGVAKLMGENVAMPRIRDAVKSAAFNAGFTAVGEGLSTFAGGAKAYRAEMEAVPNVQSRGSVQAAMKNRELYSKLDEKGLGIPQAQIDAVLKNPGSRARVQEQIISGARTKQAFQNVVDHTRDTFHARYTSTLGPQAATPVDVSGLAQHMREIAAGDGQHELSPSYANFLNRKANELDPVGQYGGALSTKSSSIPPPPGSPPPYMKARTGSTPSPKGASKTVEEVQKLRTEMRENVPRGATPLDQKAASFLHAQATETMNGPLDAAQRGGIQALDQEYGRFRSMLDTLDPRQENYGPKVADALFDPMVKNSGDALNFIEMAKAADKAKPGTMEGLREAFSQKVMAETRKPGAPIEEMKQLRALQDKWGGDQDTRAIMGEMFGKDSPFANPATFIKIMGQDPKIVADTIGKQGRVRQILNSPYMQAYALFGMGTAVSGIKGGGLWPSLTGQKGPEAQFEAVASLALGPIVLGKVMASYNVNLQKALVGVMTKPNADTMIRYMGALSGATAGGLISLPRDKDG